MIQIRPVIRDNGPGPGDDCPRLAAFLNRMISQVHPQEEYHRFGLVGPGAAPAPDDVPSAPELERSHTEGNAR